MEIIVHNIRQALMITVFVFVMMTFVDYLGVLTKGGFRSVIRGGLFRQYVIASLLGSSPGCLGAFMNVSFYIHGLIPIGALAGGMIATSGDEAFVMMAMFPEKTFVLFGVLFVTGVISAYFIDRTVPILKLEPCEACRLSVPHLEVECRCFSLNEVIDHLRRISGVRFLLLVSLVLLFFGIITGNVEHGDWNWQRVTLLSLVALAAFIVLSVPEHYLRGHIWAHIARKHI